jgi:acetylornithine deacetylase/succinyl-diaminopimelate desuccinylase-like protein
MSATLDLTLDLISRPSVTPVDADCQTIMAERLAKIGFHIEKMRFGDVDNLWARRGTTIPTLSQQATWANGLLRHSHPKFVMDNFTVAVLRT